MGRAGWPWGISLCPRGSRRALALVGVVGRAAGAAAGGSPARAGPAGPAASARAARAPPRRAAPPAGLVSARCPPTDYHATLYEPGNNRSTLTNTTSDSREINQVNILHKILPKRSVR